MWFLPQLDQQRDFSFTKCGWLTTSSYLWGDSECELARDWMLSINIHCVSGLILFHAPQKLVTKMESVTEITVLKLQSEQHLIIEILLSRIIQRMQHCQKPQTNDLIPSKRIVWERRLYLRDKLWNFRCVSLWSQVPVAHNSIVMWKSWGPFYQFNQNILTVMGFSIGQIQLFHCAIIYVTK